MKNVNEARLISSFQERLRLIMDIKGIRGSQLAIETGIHKSLIYKYLKGETAPLQDKFQMIADYFHVSYAWLLGYDADMFPDEIKNNIIESLDELNSEQLNEVYKYVIKVKENLKR